MNLQAKIAGRIEIRTSGTMRLIGELPNDAQARRFCAYLLSESIESHVDGQAKGPYEVWAKDEDRFHEALSAYQEFTANPNAEKYDAAIPKADAILREKEKKRREFRKNMVQANKTATPGTRGSIFKQAPLTAVLIAICVIVALLTEFGDVEHADRAVSRALQFVSVDAPSEELKEMATTSRDDYRVRLASVLRGEIWRVISPIFIHYGPIHILFNMIWMFQLGRILEIRYGTFRLGVIVLITGGLANLVQCMVPENWGGSVPHLINNLLITRLGGMSGVVYGLFGYIWMKSTYDPKSRLTIHQTTVLILIGWLFFCMLSPTGMGGTGRVANWAHAIGLLAGMALAFLPMGKDS
jgi:GlpG protein